MPASGGIHFPLYRNNQIPQPALERALRHPGLTTICQDTGRGSRAKRIPSFDGSMGAGMNSLDTLHHTHGNAGGKRIPGQNYGKKFMTMVTTPATAAKITTTHTIGTFFSSPKLTSGTWSSSSSVCFF